MPRRGLKRGFSGLNCTGDRRFMTPRTKKFLSYFKPYLGLFLSVMLCAFVVAAITLVLPLCTRYITKNILESHLPGALKQIYLVGASMLLLIGVQTACNFFVDYRGHTMGAMMESDMHNICHRPSAIDHQKCKKDPRPDRSRD